MAKQASGPRYKLDDLPAEVRDDIQDFRDRFGQTRRSPAANAPQPSVASSIPKGKRGGAGPVQHVMARDDGWAVVKEGSDRATRVLDTKAEAVEVAREIASNQGSKLVIHRQDGSVQETRDYGD